MYYMHLTLAIESPI